MSQSNECQHCGNAMKESDEYCKYCGSPNPNFVKKQRTFAEYWLASGEEKQEEPVKESKQHPVLAGLAIVFVISFIIVMICLSAGVIVF